MGASKLPSLLNIESADGIWFDFVDPESHLLFLSVSEILSNFGPIAPH